MININGEYVKRPGTAEDTSFVDTYTDVIFIKSLGEYFYRLGSNYISVKNGVRKTITKFFDPSTSPTSLISGAEYLNDFIFTHISGQVGTAVYDGNSIYRAGLPTPETSISPGGSDGYVLTFFEYIDAAGNIIYGPSNINTCSTGVNDITIKPPSNLGFNGSYIRSEISTTPIVLNSTSLVLPYDTISADIVAGAKVVFRNRGVGIVISDLATPSRSFSDEFIILTIDSVDTLLKEITFTSLSFNTKQISISITIGPPVIVNIHGAVVLRVLFSESETTGYTTNISSLNGFLVDNSLATQTGQATYALDRDILLSDFYDITTSKLRPPTCEFICTYGYQVVCGNVISFFDFENQETNYINNDIVMYSDLSTGDLGFNFTESNRQLIGNTYDGKITGLERVKDSMIVFKDKSVFTLDGILIPGQYSLRKVETNETGCLSFKSILSVDKLVMFQGHDGVYATNGFTCVKASTELDPFFKTIDPSLTRSTMNNTLDQYLFWTDKGIVVFNYEYKKLFIWDAINASAGITTDNSGEIRFFSPTKGEAIDAYIDTAWFDLQEPGLLKKATDIRIYSFNNAGQIIQLTYFLDWSDSLFKGPYTADMSSENTKTIHKNLDVIQNQSFSFRFANNVVDQDLNISGYEVSTTVIQLRDKNVK
jgi:hypothetical protein